MHGHTQMVNYGIVHVMRNEALTVMVPDAAATAVHCV
jgi:hypothetical protein